MTVDLPVLDEKGLEAALAVYDDLIGADDDGDRRAIQMMIRAYLSALPSAPVSEGDWRAGWQKMQSEAVRYARNDDGSPLAELEGQEQNIAELGARRALFIVYRWLDSLTAASAIRAPQGVVCATEGCGQPAGVHFERGGVGSHYCAPCYLKVQALPALATPAPSSGEAEPSSGITTDHLLSDPSRCVSTSQYAGGEADKAPALSTFLGALEEWGCEDHHEQAKAILAFLDGGRDLSEYEDRSHLSSSGEAEPAAYEHTKLVGTYITPGEYAERPEPIKANYRPLYAHPSPSGVNAPADEDAALANFDSFNDSFFATHRAAMGVNAEVVAALETLCDAVMADIREAKSRLDADIAKDAPVHPVSAFLTGTAIHVGKARSALQAQAAASGAGEEPTHRHRKRGSEYVLLGVGRMQADNWQVSCNGFDQSIDMEEVSIYRNIEDGSLWVRPCTEFEDGRFEALSPTPTEPTEGR